MQAYYRLQQELLVITLVLTGIISIATSIFYDINIALNYLIGACVGIAYLRMLSRDVATLGFNRQRPRSFPRFALLIALIVVASQWNQLHVLPIFLGFLTYKATLFVYTVRTVLRS